MPVGGATPEGSQVDSSAAALSRVLSCAVGALSLTVGMAAEVPMPRAGEAWCEVRTPRCVVVSNSPESRVASLAADLDHMVETVGRVVPSTMGRSSRVLVFLFNSRSDFLRSCRPLAGGACDGLAGLFTKRTLGPLILTDATNLDSARSIAYHELTHALVRSSSPDVPLWVEEGLAELYSTFQVTGETARIGHPLPRHLETIRQHGVLPLERLLAIDIESGEYSANAERPRFYATSWLLTHYLIVGSPARRDQLPRFVAEVRRGQPPGVAFQTAFGCEPSTIEAELALYAGAAQIPVLQLEVSNAARVEGGRPRALPPDETLTHLATLYIDTSEEGCTDAASLLLEALRLNPGSTRAMALRGWALAQLGHGSEATTLLEQALRLAPSDPDTLVLYARSLLEIRASRRSPGIAPVPATELARPRELLGRALHMAPEHVLALVTLGRSFVISPDSECSGGILPLSRALELDPDATEAAFFLAQLLARSGSPARAEEVITRYLASSSDPGERAKARALRADIAVLQARRLDTEGRHEEGIRMLEDALASSRDREPQERLRRELDRLRQAESVRLLAARVEVMSTAAALGACSEVLATLTDPALRAQVETLQATLRSGATGPRPAPPAPPPGPGSATSPPGIDRTPASRTRPPERAAWDEAQRLNQAVALADRGEVEAALRILDDLAARASRGAIREAAADFATRLRAGKVSRPPSPSH